jgi:ABC-type multidrug transport system permease subunit
MNSPIKSRQLLQLTKALFSEIIREPGVIFWGIVFPILISLGLGLAFTKKGDIIRKIAVIESSVSNSAVVSGFLENMCETNNSDNNTSHQWIFTIPNEKLGSSVFLIYERDSADAAVMLKRGTVNLIIQGRGELVEYHFDPRNADAELSFLKLSNIIGNGKSVSIAENAEIKPLTVKGTRYIDFLVPGLITLGVMMSTMWGISYGIIEKRSKKLLRRLVATPMKKSHFLLALMTVRTSMNVIEAAVLIIFAIIAFNMSIQGSLAALILMFIAGNVAFSGIAIFVSSHTSNTEVGNGLINAVVMPMMVLSGIFFSYQNFPDWSIAVIQKLPLTMLTDGIRGIFNEGAGLREVLIPVLVLSSTGIIFFGAGLKIFKWH